MPEANPGALPEDWILKTLHAVPLERTPAGPDHAMLEALSRETATPPHIVRTLYEEETARLNAQARLRLFVPVIAIKRVKQRLRQRDY